jgi:hypothetical protein
MTKGVSFFPQPVKPAPSKPRKKLMPESVRNEVVTDPQKEFAGAVLTGVEYA